MIDLSHELPITRQAKLLSISRGRVYYKARAVSVADLAIMRRIDELRAVGCCATCWRAKA
jgi:putative transposase